MPKFASLSFPSLRGSFLAGAMLLAPPAPAQEAGHARGDAAADATACTAPATLPPALATWSASVPMKAAGKTAGLNAAQLTPGQAVTLTLLPTPKVSYPLRPEKPGGSVSYGGLVRFVAAQAGTWRVALGSGAWVDVVKDGKAATSIAHGHGPACTGVRKMVDYDLTPGTYVLQVAANGSDSLGLLVTRLP